MQWQNGKVERERNSLEGRVSPRTTTRETSKRDNKKQEWVYSMTRLRCMPLTRMYLSSSAFSVSMKTELTSAICIMHHHHHRMNVTHLSLRIPWMKQLHQQ